MRTLLKNLPYFDHSEAFFLEPVTAGRFVTILPRQIPLRISLRPSAVHTDVPSASSFPAVLDTGFNGTLIISTYHLRTWARLTPDQLGPTSGNVALNSNMQIRSLSAELRKSTIWIHPNDPGTWNRGKGEAHRVAHAGIFVVQSEPTTPNSEPELRLPLLGMRALEQPGKKSRLEIDFSARRVQLRG